MPIKKTVTAALVKTPSQSRVQPKAKSANKSANKSVSKPKPLVAVIMGSSSDWDVMANAVAILEHFGIAHESQVISAHRMPHDMVVLRQTHPSAACVPLLREPVGLLTCQAWWQP